MEQRTERFTVAGARVFAGELILCLSEIRRVASESTIYPNQIAKALSRILVTWEPYATRMLRLPPLKDEDGTGFSRVGILHDVDEVLRPLLTLYEALGESRQDFNADVREVREPLVCAVLTLRMLRNKRGIKEAVDDLLRPVGHAA